MNRFDCPKCKGPLRFRMLQHVQREDGKMAFSCIHCGATLTYNRERPFLSELFYSTRLRSIATLLGGMVAISYISGAAGRWTALGVIGLFALLLVLEHQFSKKPAYEVIEAPGKGRK